MASSCRVVKTRSCEAAESELKYILTYCDSMSNKRFSFQAEPENPDVRCRGCSAFWHELQIDN